MNLKRNLDKLKKYANALEDLKRKSVAVGVPEGNVGSKVYDDGSTVSEIAAKHEFGQGTTPKRSFLVLTTKKKDSQIEQAVRRGLQNVFDGSTVDKELNLLGLTVREFVQDAFASGGFGEWPELSQQTIDSKGKSSILIDTNVLRSSITWVVRRN